MPYKALIFDLDNTIYPVQSIADSLFRDLFQLLDESGEAREQLDGIKADIQRKPFQWVAKKYGLSDRLTQSGIELLKHLTINEPMTSFPDYGTIRILPQEKFLVTTGFTALQQSKIRKMGLENDFREIYIIDPETTTKTKKDIFEEIMQTYQLIPSDILVIGDDMDSEIKAAQDLGIKAVLYRKNSTQQINGVTVISDFTELSDSLNS